MNNDTSIIYRLKQGDNEAYRYLFDSEYEVMCRFARQMLHDAVAAEAVVDDVVYSMWRHRDTLDITGTLRQYLLGAVRNRCINELRARSRHRICLAADEEVRLWETLFVDDRHPLGTLLEQELEQQLMQGIRLLPEECQRVFEKSRFEQMSYREIASATGISVNTVKYHIKRALAFLQDYLRDYIALVIAVLSFR